MDVCVGVGAVCKSTAVAAAVVPVIATGTSEQCPAVLFADSGTTITCVDHMSILGYSKLKEPIIHHNYT